MKNSEIKQLYNGLIDLTSSTELKLNAKTSFTIAKNKMLLQPLYELISAEEEKIWKTLGRPNSEGGITVPAELVNELKKQLQELNDIDNEIEIQKISLDDFGDEKISIATIQKLMLMIKEA